MSAFNIDLHIDRLILHGFDGVSRVALGASVERELTRILEQEGMTDTALRSENIERAQGGTFTAGVDTDTDTMGSQIARAIYGGLSR
jgi:hypothetical protein